MSALRSVQVGRSRFSRCCHLLGDLSSDEARSGPGLFIFEVWTNLTAGGGVIQAAGSRVTKIPLVCEPARQLLHENLLAQFAQDFVNVRFRVALWYQVIVGSRAKSPSVSLWLVGSAVCSQSRKGCFGLTTMADRFSMTHP